MEKDGVTRVYVGHPLRVSGEVVTNVSAREVYPARGVFIDNDEETAIGIWASADVQLISRRVYAGEQHNPLTATLLSVAYEGIVHEPRGVIRVEHGLMEAVKNNREFEVIAHSVESLVGRTGLTIMCE
jgi:hypothetical protein